MDNTIDSFMLLTTQILFTIFIIILIPIYWKKYGPKNFLWLSDIGLFLIVLALWYQSSLLNSMVAIGILPLELFWNVDFVSQLFTGRNNVGMSNYMFDQQYPLWLRIISLFHIFLPIVCIWGLFAWGYNPDALYYQLILNTIAFTVSYFVSRPEENINWVNTPTIHQWKKIKPLSWLLILLIGIPIIIILPMHLLLLTLFS